MEFSEVVRRRRIVRNYDPERPVSRESLMRIAAAAQRAPSAGFSQGQRLVVVTDAERRRHIAEICREPDKLQDDGNEINWPIPYWYTDIGATALLVHLAAIDEGLAAGFLGLADYTELKNELAIPADQ